MKLAKPFGSLVGLGSGLSWMAILLSVLGVQYKWISSDTYGDLFIWGFLGVAICSPLEHLVKKLYNREAAQAEQLIKELREKIELFTVAKVAAENVAHASLGNKTPSDASAARPSVDAPILLLGPDITMTPS